MNIQQIISIADQAAGEPVYDDPRFPPSLYYRFLRLLTRYTQPDVSVELGVCGGGGCLYMADGHHAGQVYGIDIVNDYPAQLAHIKQQRSNFHLIVGDSVYMADSWDHGKIDILFIDTIHTYQRTLDEYNAWKRHLADNAIIVFDDLFRDGMEQAFYEIPGVHVRLDFLHHESGFGVILCQE